MSNFFFEDINENNSVIVCPFCRQNIPSIKVVSNQGIVYVEIQCACSGGEMRFYKLEE